MKKGIIFLLITNAIAGAIILYVFAKHDYPSTIMAYLKGPVPHVVDSSYCVSAPDTVTYEEEGYRWVKLTCAAEFAERDGSGALVYKDQMWLMGGWNPRNKDYFPLTTNNEVWKSETGEQWTCVKENTFKDTLFDPNSGWEGRHCAGYAVFKDTMWIIGGDGNQGHYQVDVWNSVNGADWSRVTESVPWGPRVAFFSAVYKDKIWIMGGQTMPQFAAGIDTMYNDIWTSDDGRSWERLDSTDTKWAQRGMIGGSAVFKDRLWVIAGGTYDTPEHPERHMFNDVWSTTDGKEWVCHTPAAQFKPREYVDIAAYDGKLWMLEGLGVSLADGFANKNDVWYSEDGTDWKELKNTPWMPRHASSIFVHRDCLYVVAGNNMESDVWKLEKL